MVNQGRVFMQHNLLILGGTSEASALAHLIAKTDIKAIISYAGRVQRIRPQPIQKRIGGFGGVEGLKAYIEGEQITHVIDATHPFAAQMSANAHIACAQSGVQLAALTRPAWQPETGDKWHQVADIRQAVEWLETPARRVMLAIGRLHLDAFTAQPHHFYLLRLVDSPEIAPDFLNKKLLVSRGPFTPEADLKLLKEHQIDLVVSKNAGGQGAYAKILAARELGIDVVMINRPVLPQRLELYHPEAVLDWLNQS